MFFICYNKTCLKKSLLITGRKIISLSNESNVQMISNSILGRYFVSLSF